MQTRKEQLEFSEFNEVDEFMNGFNASKGSDFVMIKLIVYFTDSDNIELNFVNILTREEALFDYLMIKFQGESHYLPGMSKKIQ